MNKQLRSFFVILVLVLSTFSACSSDNSSNNNPINPVGEIESPYVKATEKNIIDAFDSRLKADAGYNEANQEYQHNLRLLAESIQLAAGENGVRQNQQTLNNIVNYVVKIYGLDIFSDYVAVGLIDTINAIKTDENIYRVAKTLAIYPLVVPLAFHELPKDDNIKRANYYFNSDLSPLVVAEELLHYVKDDTISDEVFYQIASIKAEHKLIDQALRIVETQIFQSQLKGETYIKIAREQIKYGFTQNDILLNIRKADEIYKNLINLKGIENFSTQDARNMMQLIYCYRAAGLDLASENVITYCDNILKELQLINVDAADDFRSRLIINFRDAAEDSLEDGNTIEAARFADKLYEYALGHGVSNGRAGRQTYRAKVFYLCIAAKLYGQLKDKVKTIEVFDKVEAIRTNDGLQYNMTKNQTWFYTSYLIEALYHAGEDSKALQYYNSIPDKYDGWKWSWRDKVWEMKKNQSNALVKSRPLKTIVTYKALADGLGTISPSEPASILQMSALDIVEYLIKNNEDKAEALLSFGIRDHIPHVAASLIERGSIADLNSAKIAINKSIEYLDKVNKRDEDDQVRDQFVFGYVKAIRLYHKLHIAAQTHHAAGDRDALLKAQQLLDKVIPIMENFTGAKNLTYGYRELAVVASVINNIQQSEDLMSKAFSSANKFKPTTFKTFKQKVSLYFDLNDSCLEKNDKSGAAVAAEQGQIVAKSLRGDFVSSAKEKKEHVEQLIRIAKCFVLADQKNKALSLLEASVKYTRLIDNHAYRTRLFIYQRNNPITSTDSFVEIYSFIGEHDIARSIIRDDITTIPEKNLAWLRLAEIGMYHDKFPDTEVASVDTDNDGKPDFFKPLATQAEILASGLVLDKDCDNDGILDSDDTRPFIYDTIK